MSIPIAREETRRAIVSAGIASVAVMALTIAHHAYGALIYPAAFRGHVALIGIPVTMAIIGTTTLSVHKLGSGLGSAARILAIILMTAVPVLGVGLYEGLYNHLFKDVVYLLGFYDQVAGQLFPATMYERPNDWLFEISGVMQFVAAVYAATKVWRLFRISVAGTGTAAIAQG